MMKVLNRPAGSIIPEKIQKTWGFELVYMNDNGYCCKVLYFEPGKSGDSTSLHFHVEKHETLVVVEGQLEIEYVDNKERKKVLLNEFESWVVPPGHVHKLKKKSDCLILFEASTYDRPEDSIRIEQ